MGARVLLGGPKLDPCIGHIHMHHQSTVGGPQGGHLGSRGHWPLRAPRVEPSLGAVY